MCGFYSEKKIVEKNSDNKIFLINVYRSVVRLKKICLFLVLQQMLMGDDLATLSLCFRKVSFFVFAAFEVKKNVNFIFRLKGRKI